MLHDERRAEPREYRCRDCGKLLFKGIVVDGIIEVKCRSCHATTRVAEWQCGELLCMIPKCPQRVHHPSANS